MIYLFFIASLIFSGQVFSKEMPDYEISQTLSKSIDKLTTSNGNFSKKLFDIEQHINSVNWKSNQNKYRLKAAKTLGTEQYLEKGEIELDRSAKVIVFISESVPLKTLRNYASVLDKVGGALIMRGVIGDMSEVRPTALFSSEVLKIDSTCRQNCKFFKTQVLIDPLLFRKYNISSVPAITVQKGVQFQTYCHSVDQIKTNDTVVYGDVSVEYALGRYLDEKSDSDVDFLLKKL